MGGSSLKMNSSYSVLLLVCCSSYGPMEVDEECFLEQPPICGEGVNMPGLAPEPYGMPLGIMLETMVSPEG
jgi:hypothetical protein